MPTKKRQASPTAQKRRQPFRDFVLSILVAAAILCSDCSAARRGGLLSPFSSKRNNNALAFAFNDGELWALRVTSAVTSYFGFLTYLDRPRGQLLENADTCLEVKQSSVPGAGLGLFARVNLPKGTVLGTYPGVVIPIQQNLDKLRKCPQCEYYVWRFSNNKYVIDPTSATDGELKSLCQGGNPSMPLSVPWFQLLQNLNIFQVPTTLCRINEPPLGKDVNVVTDEDRDKLRVVFSLERDVYAGEEFYIDYGLNYDRSSYAGDSNSLE